LQTQTQRSNKIREIIVVDDKSTDSSVDYLKKNFASQFKLIRHKENRGFSAAVNTGVRMARSELICLLNTDVAPSKNFLEKAISHFKNKKVFAVSLHEKGYGYALAKFSKGFIVHSPGKEKRKASPTFWVNGGSGVFKRSIWMSLKGMDEKLFSPFYWEDIDICYRALKRGYQLLWEPKSKVIHQHEATVNPNNFSKRRLNIIKERNQLLFIWKNLTSPIIFKKHLSGLFLRIFKNPGYLIPVLVALLKIKTLRRLREREKREAIVSDEAIFARFNTEI